MIKQNRKTQAALFGGILSMLVGGQALAEDGKAYPGTLCVENLPEAITYSATGSARNLASRAVRWICPAVRDGATASTDINDWDVTVNRRGNSDLWEIFLRSSNPSGTSFFQSAITGPGGNATQTLDGGSITSSFNLGPYFITSLVPPNAELFSYQVTES